MLSAAGRLNPYTYDDDPSFRRLIDLLPFGLPAEPPQHRHPVLKGHHPAIGAADKVILWGGGLWPWFDAPTLVRAMPHILKVRSDVRLLFLGVQRPGHRAPSPTVEAVIALSRQLGLEEHVVFGGWVPYAERENYLLEADVGVSLHLDNVETRFAFRTRLLDYLWAGLPIVATMGDPLGERLADADLAIPVAPGDARGVAQAIVQALGRPREAVRRKAEALAPRFYWDRVVQPLVDFCNAPHLAADKGKPPFILTRSSRRTLWEKVRYLDEIARVLKVGGRCMATFFVLNEESKALIRAGRSTLPFRYEVEGCLTLSTRDPEAAVAYEEEAVFALLSAAGLRLSPPIHYGSWCGRENFLSYQDIVVAVKEAPVPSGAAVA